MPHSDAALPSFPCHVLPKFAAEKGAVIADGFGNAIRVRLGRIDATEPAPAGRLPGKEASLEEVQVGRGSPCRSCFYTDFASALSIPALDAHKECPGR